MFRYFGAKRKIAHVYPAPVYSTVVEPFAGSAAYAVHALEQRTAQRAVLVEKDERVATLWERLLAMTPAELMALPIPEVGERTDDLLWMLAQAGNAILSSSFTTVTERQRKDCLATRLNIAEELPYLRGRVEIIRGNYDDAPDIEATWFIDPPYQATRGAGAQGDGYGPGCRASDLDYTALGEWCRTRRGQVIVAEQLGADWLPFWPLTQRVDNNFHPRVEVMWTQGSPVETLFPDGRSLMRQAERDTILDAICASMETLTDGIRVAFERCDNWSGKGYPTSSFPEVSISTGDHSDPVADVVAQEQADIFAMESHDAECALARIRDDLRGVVAFINRNTALAVQSIKGGSIQCTNCPHRMTGLGNDRPRVGRCTRCYTHWKRHGRDWPLKPAA